ncbi:MAG: CHAT domain-containing protein, partial [Dehalococcoidia bacterium]
MTNHTGNDETFSDVEIRIFPGDEGAGGYPVEITLGGQQEFPRGYLSADVLQWTASGDSMADGQRLFEMLTADSALQSAWAEIRGQAPQRRIRLRIDSGAANLHALPWELLHEGTAMLSAQASTPFSRYLPIALPWGGPVEERPIRVLAVISNPDDLEEKYNLAPVDVEKERESLESAFASANPDDMKVDFLDAPVTLERLEEKLSDGDGYHIIHYLGHGAFNARRGQGVLYMQDEEGLTRLVLDDELAQLLARQGIRPRLVFLAACQSASRSTNDAFLGLAPKLISAGVPAVVAMQDLISVESARKFGDRFYQRLLEHGQVDLAVNEARSTLLTAGRADAGVPVAFMRLKSGQLWGAEADARGQVLGARNPRIFWTGLVRMIQQRKCTPILGPRAHGRWLPTPQQVARKWSDLHEYPFADREELARVAQYMATNQGEDFPRYELLDTLMAELTARLPEGLRPDGQHETLTDLVQAVGWQNLVADDPNQIHQVLASLNLPLYLTTNPDSFLVEALTAQGQQPEREICRWSEQLDWLPSRFEEDDEAGEVYEPTPETPLVYHLFGSDEEVNSLVLTEDDYMRFLVRVVAERDRIPNTIREALSSSTLMFVGYSLYDWEFRVLMHGLVASLNQRLRFKHVAVQLEFDEAGMADTAAVQTFLQ